MSKILFREGNLIRTEHACTKFEPFEILARTISEAKYYLKKQEMGCACKNCIIHEGRILCIHTAIECNGQGVHRFTPAKQLELFDEV